MQQLLLHLQQHQDYGSAETVVTSHALQQPSSPTPPKTFKDLTYHLGEEALHTFFIYFVWQSIANSLDDLHKPFPVKSLAILGAGEIGSSVGLKLVFELMGYLRRIHAKVSDDSNRRERIEKYIRLFAEACFSGIFWQPISNLSQFVTSKCGYPDTLNPPRILSSLVLYAAIYSPVLTLLNWKPLKEAREVPAAGSNMLCITDSNVQIINRSHFITFIALVLKITCMTAGAWAFDMAGPAPYGSPASTRANALVDALYGSFVFAFVGLIGITAARAYDQNTNYERIPTSHV